MVRIVKQSFGSQILMGIYGENSEELEQTFNSFYNHGATNGEPDYGGALFLTFWTTPQKLDKYFENSSYHVLMNQCGDKPGENFENEVKELANRRKLSIIEEKIIEYGNAKNEEDLEFTSAEEIPAGLQEANE